MEDPIILDTTLRDGEQTPGIYFTHDEKIALAHELDSLGVGIIEVGVPGMGRQEQSVIRDIIRANLSAKILTWNRLSLDDLKASLDAGAEHIHVAVPTSSQMLQYKLRKPMDWVLKQMRLVIESAIHSGAQVSFGAEDASRTDDTVLLSVFRYAQELGALRVRYADTLGIMTPDKTSSTIGFLRRYLQIPIDFHAHNDFGMATANTLCAWKAGAQVLSCSLLGLGERTGNTALEEIVGALRLLENRCHFFNLKQIKALCQKLAEKTQRPMPVNKPLLGDSIFIHESGIHVDGLIKAPQTYEFYPPEIVDGQRTFIIGKHSGRTSVKYLAKSRGYQLSDEQAAAFLNMLRTKMAESPAVNAETEFVCYLAQLNRVAIAG